MSSTTAGSVSDSHAGGGQELSLKYVREFFGTYVFSLDHKIIGLQFLFSTLLWFLVGGLLALGIRWPHEPVTQHIQRRKRHVVRTNHQWDQVVSKSTGQNRNDNEEDHHRGVHRK